MKDIKELRKITGLSQSKFAEKYGISVRTLQQWEQGISKPIDALVGLIEKDISSTSNLRFLHKPKNNNIWKICIKDPFINCERIYPIQQNRVKALVDDLSSDKQTIKIIIFGSSVTNRCHMGSDIDIYVETENKDVRTKGVYDFEYDLWSNYSSDDRLKKEIYDKGVVVYERN